MIKTECYSDDQCVQVQFDATPWFKSATPIKVQALCDCGWGGDYASDEIAEFMEPINSEIKAMFAYIHARRAIEDMGFECHVDPDDAKTWLKANRPTWKLHIIE